ncbi:hypothetical protein F4779DRAFT_621032 [Xylariaceae sp. FL0662B]|nr:hypothetical protein F4779DRAFT_621032 [Xylariaceae sp. FL0662B]
MHCLGWHAGRKCNSPFITAQSFTALRLARQALRVADRTAPAPTNHNSQKISKLFRALEHSRVTLQFEDRNSTSTTEGLRAHKYKTKMRGDLAR